MPGLMFFVRSILLGIGLAMDAFSVSLANGLNEPSMSKTKAIKIASIFSFFQFIMPIIGWICVHTLVIYFEQFEKFIPWIALFLLFFLGIKMIIDSCKGKEQCIGITLTFTTLILQGIATSIDALSVGFTISNYVFWEALLSCCIIAIITFILCMIAIKIGKKFGTKLSSKATIVGGIILIIIGIEIFLSGILG